MVFLANVDKGRFVVSLCVGVWLRMPVFQAENSLALGIFAQTMGLEYGRFESEIFSKIRLS